MFVVFYGDDFTGSTDVMESLSRNGLPAALFLKPPSIEETRNFRLKNTSVSTDGRLKAFGVAGVSRSMTTAGMDEELPAIFEGLSKIPARYFHYKICSTFDSAPEIGNIGHAVEIALRYFPSTWIPLVVGAPFLNRFCVFGNLFARVEDITYRLDRHPTMSKHPVTPMHESDLRVHLRRQTNRQVQLIDVLQLADTAASIMRAKRFHGSGDYVLLDVLTDEHLAAVGRVLHACSDQVPQLLVGSSAVEYALIRGSAPDETVRAQPVSLVTSPAAQYMVVAGSCSPGTARQINHGFSIGYTGIRLDSIRLIENSEEEIGRCAERCVAVLSDGGVPVMYSALGPDDTRIEETSRRFRSLGDGGDSIGAFLGRAQGQVVKRVLDQVGKLRVTVAGGDTSGYVSKTLGISALEMLVPIAPGAPLCIAHAADARYDGLEIALKGGQNGDARYLESVQAGRSL